MEIASGFRGLLLSALGLLVLAAAVPRDSQAHTDATELRVVYHADFADPRRFSAMLTSIAAGSRALSHGIPMTPDWASLAATRSITNFSGQGSSSRISAPQRTFYLSYHPVVAEGLALVADAREILAVRLATGKAAWGPTRNEPAGALAIYQSDLPALLLPAWLIITSCWISSSQRCCRFFWTIFDQMVIFID